MTNAASLKLLLVEDSPTDAGLIQANLRIGLGAVDVHRVGRLSSAITSLSQDSFSVILLDLNLPDSSGIETFHRLAVNANGTPIVVLSGMDDCDTAISAVSSGADDYVQKNHYDYHTLARSVRFAIERCTRRAAERELTIVRNELSVAQSVQDRLYPKCNPKIAGLDIASGIRSAGIGCGDYYDFIALNDGRHMFVVGDVAGHGMGSAIVMAETRACLRTLTDISIDPQMILPTMNGLIHAGTAEGMFVTLLVVIFDPFRNSFEYFNAGHPGWIVRKDENQQLITHQIPLGLLAGLDYSNSDMFSLNSGDILVIPTDGIQESTGVSGIFGSERMLNCVHSNRDLPAVDIVDRLFTAAIDFSVDEVQSDDMTLMIVKAD